MAVRKISSFFGRLTFCLALVLLLYSATIAQQLEPNPNPFGNTIYNNFSENFVNFDNFGTIYNIGEIDNWLPGTIWNWDTGIISNYVNINNEGNITNSPMGVITNDQGNIVNAGTIDNAGTINNMRHAVILNSGTINNDGALINRAEITNTSTINNTGYILNVGNIDSRSGYFNNSGFFKGTGIFEGTLDTGSGIVAPGYSAGKMFVDGDYILDGSGILEIEIGGFTPGSFDLLDITGTAYLYGGTIDFSFLTGYDIASEISPGQSLMLQFLKAGSIDSFASSIKYDFLGSPPGFQYDVFQQGGGLFFQATNMIPAPGAILLASIGVAVVGWLRRRKTL